MVLPVSGARFCEAGEGEEELAVLPAPPEAGDGADAGQADLTLFAAASQAVDLQLGCHVCHIASQQDITLQNTCEHVIVVQSTAHQLCVQFSSKRKVFLCR